MNWILNVSGQILGLGDNVCTPVEHVITDKDILSSLVSNAANEENNNDIVEENSLLWNHKNAYYETIMS